jgi:NADH:ubiquinone oxidoreductase subunit K
MMDALLHITWMHYGVVSALIFGAGLATVLVRKNAIAMLLGIELIINAAAINFVAAAYYLPKTPGMENQTSAGTVFAVFVIVTAAAEAAVALAIIMNFYNSANSIDLSRADQLSG